MITMVRKRLFLILSIIGLLIISSPLTSAQLKIDGTLKAEVTSDPLRFDPSAIRDESRKGIGTSLSGINAGEVLKMRLDLSLTDEKLEVFWPLTIATAGFTDELSVPNWQTYLLFDDLLSSPYHAWFHSDYFRFSFCNQRVNDKLGFKSLNDLLGIGWRPNSNQPLFSASIKGENWPGGWKGQASILFDQKVEGIPIWEQIPSGEGEIAHELVGGIPVKEYGFIDELAQYNFFQLSRPLGAGLKLSFLWNQKVVDNPELRLSDAQNEESIPQKLAYWSYTKENKGVSLEGNLAENLEFRSIIVKSDVAWREYETSRETGRQIGFVNRYYPYETKGTLQGNASAIEANLKLNQGRSISLASWAVDPSFQSVAAVHGQFPVIEQLKYDSDGNLIRRAVAVFDPVGELVGFQTASSPAIDYLGKHAFRIGFSQPGQIASWPVILKVVGEKVTGLENKETHYVDPRTGAIVNKDHNELLAELMHEGLNNLWRLTALNREYQVDKDFLRSLEAQYIRDFSGLKLTGILGETSRLRADDLLGEGEMLRVATILEKALGGRGKLSLSADYRNGTYDYDLISALSDQVVPQYEYVGFSGYLEGKHDFVLPSGTGNLHLAGEFLAKNTQLAGAASGRSLVGYLGLSVPLSKTWIGNLQYMGVDGPNLKQFPSGHVGTTLHHELIYQPEDNANTSFSLGLTVQPDAGNKNAYAVFTSSLGAGNIRIGYGQGTIPALMDSGPQLPGELRMVYRNGYAPASAIRERPWERWENDNFYALWDRKLRSTNNTWENYFGISYWIDF